MKKMKKMMALVIAMVMVLAMSMTVFAGDGGETTPTYKITIDNSDNENVSIVGKTYTAYKLFDVTYTGSGADDPHAYSIDSDGAGAWAWDTIKGTADANGVYTNTTYGLTFTPTAADATVYSITSTMTNDQARALADALESHRSSASVAKSSAAATAETVDIALDEAGYYLVYGTVKANDPADGSKELVAAVALTTADPAETVKPKASVPTLNKKITGVAEGLTNVNGALLDNKGVAAVAKVGSTVSYELDSVVPDLTGYTDYTFTFEDKLTGGLDYVENSFVLKIKGTTENIAPTFAADKKSFTLTIPYTTLSKAAYTKGDAIVLTYNCTVNDSALTYDFENNTADLVYSKSPYDTTTNKTPEKKTYVIDLNLDVDKIDGSDSTKHLEGAEFKLYRMAADGTTKEYYIWDTTNKKVTWGTEANADVFTTGKSGKLSQQVRGLDKGNYFLVETKAPKGYNLMKDPVAVVISVTEAANGETVTYSATYGGEDATMTNGEVNLTAATQSSGKQPVATGAIENNSGAELPSTGGIGTRIFYTAGAILVAAGVALLIAKKRKAEEN